MPILDAANRPDASPVKPSCVSADGVVTLVTRPPGTWMGDSIAVDDASVYWLEHGDGDRLSPGRLLRISKCGGDPITLAPTPNYPSGLALDATHVYWSSMSSSGEGSVMSVPITGGTATTLAMGGNAKALAVNSVFAYWTDLNAGAFSVPKAGDATLGLVEGEATWSSIAATDEDVVWTQSFFAMGLPAGWAVSGILFGGGPTWTLASSTTGGADSVVIDGNDVYFIASTSESGAKASISRVPLGGGAPTVLVTAHPSSLAVDATYVYWTDDASPTGPNSIQRVAKTGGTPEVLASKLEFPPWSIAVDATRVYWTSGDLVMAAPK
jgi:hypothetical protein